VPSIQYPTPLHRSVLLAVLSQGDPVEIGWASSVVTNDVLRTVWAANDLPNPSLDLGTVQRHLDDLTIPVGVAEDLSWLSPHFVTVTGLAAEADGR
jgi:hypothetical protein